MTFGCCRFYVFLKHLSLKILWFQKLGVSLRTKHQKQIQSGTKQKRTAG